MSRFYQNRADVIHAIATGAQQTDTLNGPAVGPTSFNEIRYPYAEVLPETTTRQEGNVYAHSVRLNCYFRRDRDTDYLDQLAAAMDALSNALAELRDTECVGQFVPTTIEDFAGEFDNTALILISTEIQTTTQVDEADIGT